MRVPPTCRPQPAQGSSWHREPWGECTALSYHAFDAFGEEKAVVQGADGVIREDLTLLLKQKVPGVQTIICPEDGKPPFLVPMDEGPRDGRVTPESRRKDRGKGGLGASPPPQGRMKKGKRCLLMQPRARYHAIEALMPL